MAAVEVALWSRNLMLLSQWYTIFSDLEGADSHLPSDTKEIGIRFTCYIHLKQALKFFRMHYVTVDEIKDTE